MSQSLHDILYHPDGVCDIVTPKNGDRYSDRELVRFLETHSIGLVPSRMEPNVIGLVDPRAARISAFYNKAASEILGAQICGSVLVCPRSRLSHHVGQYTPR